MYMLGIRRTRNKHSLIVWDSYFEVKHIEFFFINMQFSNKQQFDTLLSNTLLQICI